MYDLSGGCARLNSTSASSYGAMSQGRLLQLGHSKDHRLRPDLKALRPEDLPLGVTASRGYDHRGHCLIFEHKTLGELGEIVLNKIRDGQMLIQAELYKEQEDVKASLIKQKKHVFE